MQHFFSVSAFPCDVMYPNLSDIESESPVGLDKGLNKTIMFVLLHSVFLASLKIEMMKSVKWKHKPIDGFALGQRALPQAVISRIWGHAPTVQTLKAQYFHCIYIFKAVQKMNTLLCYSLYRMAIYKIELQEDEIKISRLYTMVKVLNATGLHLEWLLWNFMLWYLIYILL